MIAYIFAVIFALIFITLIIAIHQWSFQKYDEKFHFFVIRHRNSQLTKIFHFFTELGKVGPAFLVIAVLFLSPASAPTIALPVAVTAILGSGITYVVKLLVKRQRPVGHRLVEETDHSFPSAHAVGAVDVYGGIAVNAIFLIGPHTSWLLIPAIVIAFMIGFSRVYLGIHHPSDVVAGWSLGSFLVIVIGLIFKSL
jgi:undecaprenyl-diphosphatase